MKLTIITMALLGALSKAETVYFPESCGPTMDMTYDSAQKAFKMDLRLPTGTNTKLAWGDVNDYAKADTVYVVASVEGVGMGK